jgi:hypothetical protein
MIVTPREGDGTKILVYNKNILTVMAPNTNGFEFSVFEFIWKEIKVISKNPLKSCEYAPYLMHMIESDSSDILLQKGAPPLVYQEWFKSSSGGVESNSTIFFTS